MQFRYHIRDFVKRNKLREIAKEADETKIIPEDVILKAKNAGFFGITTPKEYGGFGGTITQYAIMIEEISRAYFDLSNVLAVHCGLAQFPLISFGNPAQKLKYLPKMATGELIGALGVTEPDAGANIGDTRTYAEKSDNYYKINGRKMFITNGNIADVIVTLARTSKDTTSKNALSLFIVEKDSAGFSIGQIINNKMGTRSAPTAELIFDNCEVSLDNLIGKEGGGLDYTKYTMEKGRVILSGGALGIAREALEIATDYALQRSSGNQQLHKLPIIRSKLANIFMDVYTMACLVYTTAGIIDNEENFSGKGSAAKIRCTELLQKAAYESVQILGGYGYTKDFPLERMTRDARVTTIYEGPNEVLEMIIASELLKEFS